jgi:hypothetical protein
MASEKEIIAQLVYALKDLREYTSSESCMERIDDVLAAAEKARAKEAPFDRHALYLADAKAKIEGKNLDGSERRECLPTRTEPSDRNALRKELEVEARIKLEFKDDDCADLLRRAAYAIDGIAPAPVATADEIIRAAGIVEGLEMAAKIAQGPYPARSRYSEESPFYGSDLDPDRSEFGRGKRAGREAANTAIRARIAELEKGKP